MLRPIREKAEYIRKDKAYLEGVYREGARRAGERANRTLRKVYKKIGFVDR
jgi:tryptophanyl-tRNA synthetase